MFVHSHGRLWRRQVSAIRLRGSILKDGLKSYRIPTLRSMTRLARQCYSLICLDGDWSYRPLSSNNDIAVSGFSWALRHKREFSAVITIEDPDKHYGVRFHKSPHPEHLILKFVDLDS